MLSREDNELLTRVGPGTAMGDTMRRYWIPALLAWELPEPDCPPVRVRLLGEDLVAFRDTSGRVGLLDEYCPHRRASLFFGRNEGCGLRCVYHGWKFDADGQCVDMMNEPEEHQFGHKIHIAAYPTQELGGVIWAYMGPRELQPAPPRFAWTGAPATHLHISKVIQENNWLQGLEGGIDTSHAPIMHRLITENSTRAGFKPSNPFVRGKAPNLVVDLTDYGYQYAGIRPLDEGTVHIRTYHFILPFHQIRPSQTPHGLVVAGHMWVPMDDDNTMVYNWEYSLNGPLTEEERLETRLGNGPENVDQATFRSRKQPRQQLHAGPPRAEDREFHRDRRHQCPGPRDPGEHGPRRGPEPRASGPGGQGDHPGAAAAAGRGARGAGGRRAPRRGADLLSAARRRGCPPARRGLAERADAGRGAPGDRPDGLEVGTRLIRFRGSDHQWA